jgi:hypothetical protein
MDGHPLKLGVGLLMAWSLGFTAGLEGSAVAAPEIETIANADEYFPDTQGSRWRYRGQVVEGPLQKVSATRFTNVSTVQGTETLKGVMVKVFHDTNPGNHGPSDSYYRRDAAGIVYYGSQPGTPLEKQLVPYQIVRFPLVFPSSFQQFDRKGLNLGTDLDGDDKDERTDVEATVTVTGRETITVPSGSYRDAIRLEARMRMQIHLTATERTVSGTDVMTAWFAKGVGLVKYVERQELPLLKSDGGLVTEITEELEEVEIKPQVASLDRGEPATQGIFTDHARHHELAQIVFSARLRSDPGQTMPAERLSADQGAGDGTVDVKVSHVERVPRDHDVGGAS